MPQGIPDTLVGTDSHTTMINGLGVLGWGVGGIEAEAALLAAGLDADSQVVGFRLTGKLSEGATATDLVLTVTEMPPQEGRSGSSSSSTVPDRHPAPRDPRPSATWRPSTAPAVGIFPVDQETCATSSSPAAPGSRCMLVEAYMKEQGLFHSAGAPEPVTRHPVPRALDRRPSLPGRGGRRTAWRCAICLGAPSRAPALVKPTSPHRDRRSTRAGGGRGRPRAHRGGGAARRRTHVDLQLDGCGLRAAPRSVVDRAITSCTNTSNPSVVIAAGLVAKKRWRRARVAAVGEDEPRPGSRW